MNEALAPDFKLCRHAIARVRDKLPAPALCRYCLGAVKIVSYAPGAEVYGGPRYWEWPWVYACTGCDAYIGMHPFTDIPLGTLADAPTRQARHRCKAVFDRLHAEGNIHRRKAYRLLAEQLGISVRECHFGWFDPGMCERARQAAESLRIEVERPRTE